VERPQQPLRLEREGDLALLTIDSPPLNLFDARLFAALADALDELERVPPRALLLRAEGKVVSGGVHVETFRGLTAARARSLYERWLGLARRLERLPLPTVFAAHALCLTAAFELALACDLLLASESARFGLVEVVIGLTPSMGGTQRLAARAGSGRALELVLTGEVFDAATLERWNVVNRVFPDAELAAASLALARRLAAGPTLAHAATKSVVRAHEGGGVPGADAVLPEIGAALLETGDARRAIESFLTRGPARSRHRGD